MEVHVKLLQSCIVDPAGALLRCTSTHILIEMSSIQVPDTFEVSGCCTVRCCQSQNLVNLDVIMETTSSASFAQSIVVNLVYVSPSLVPQTSCHQARR